MPNTEIDNYVRGVVLRHTPVPINDVVQKAQGLFSHINLWANGYEYDLKLSGSYAKGTAIHGTTDVDFFISLPPSVSDYNTLEFVYKTLKNRMNQAGIIAREQNVSLGLQHGDLKIDLIPGVRHNPNGSDHSLWKRKAQSWTKTNIDTHINKIVGSDRIFDIKLVKIWRKLHNIEFPSFYLELSVLEALKNKPKNDPTNNFLAVMDYLCNDFISARILDPSNTNNVISEELSSAEKKAVKDFAAHTLQSTWETIFYE